MKKNVLTTAAITLFSATLSWGTTGESISTINPNFEVVSEAAGTPVMYRKGDKIYLNLLNSELKNVVISISDSKNRVLYRKVLKNDLTVGKVFNFENAENDRYIIKVLFDGESYIEKVAVN